MSDYIKREVEKKLNENGIKAYIYAFEMTDDGLPYFAYTFNKEVVEEAKRCWNNGLILEDCYDDYSFEEHFDLIVRDIFFIIKKKYKEKQR